MSSKDILVTLVALLASSSCSSEPCGSLSAIPLDGSYRERLEGASPLGLQDVTVDADGSQVILTYTRSGGARFRARYRVIEKL